MTKHKRIDLTQLENQYKERIEHNSLYAPDADKEDDLFVISDLIAELKRCYEEIDALQGIIDDAHEAMEKYSNDEIDNVCDAYEEVCMALY